MDLFSLTRRIFRREPDLSREDILYFAAVLGFFAVILLLTFITFTSGDFPSFLHRLTGIEWQ